MIAPIADHLEILRALSRGNVKFVVIGQIAASLRGSAIPTFDVDVCYERSPGNIRRLVAVLRQLNARLRVGRTSGEEAEALPFQLDEQAIESGGNFTFVTDLGSLDCLAWPAGVTGFDELVEQADSFDIDDVQVFAASVDHLLEMRRKAAREKDLERIFELEEIKRIQESGEGL